MKKLSLLLAILLCVGTAFALQVSAPTLSGLPGANVSTTFTVTNNDTFVVSNISAGSTADSRFNVVFENVPQSLGPNQSAVITVKGFVPSDFAPGKRSIGNINVFADGASASSPFGSHTFNPQTQSPQDVVLPVGMSAANDCGQNTPDVGMPIIGQWHSGVCDGANDITVSYPFEDAVDGGWARIHSANYTDYWIGAVALDCGGQAQVPPNNWTYGGKIHTNPGVCDSNIELPSGDSGWMGLYSRPIADGKLLFVIAENKCNAAVQTVPSNGVVLGKVKTGPYVCDGSTEGYAHDGTALDAGSMYVVYVPVDHAPQNFLPVGEFEVLNASGIRGWAYDSDTPSTTVHVYVDGNFWKEFDADVPRSDLTSLPDSAHGFSYDFSQSDLAGFGSGNHTFNVYAINSPEGENPLLNGSPKSFVFSYNGTVPSGSISASAVLYMENTQVVNTTNTTNTSTNTGSNTNTNTPTSRLVIDRVKLSCDKLKTVVEGSSYEVAPGQTCYLTVKVKNYGDLDIEDVRIEVDADYVDADDADISYLDSGDSEEKTIEIKIDEDADEDDVRVEITADGEDEDGDYVSDTFYFYLEVERPKHDLQISRVVVSPQQADVCSDSRVDVTVYIENRGSRDEDEAAVEFSVPSLNFVRKTSDLYLDSGDEQRVYFTIPVNSNTRIGSFIATVRTYYDNVALSNTDTANIAIVKCSAAVNSNSNSNSGSSYTEPVVTPPPYVPQDDVIIVPPAQTESNSTWANSAVLTAVLVLANLIALTVLGVMVYGYFRKQPEEAVEEQAEQSSFNEYY
ncbi:hypothetical protein KY309_03800 [Candidatus Woesearchaeota archaeon]|nr:hypothetical protein [Candidatus Woesearchaeota archaeon]MBW3016706.1 hypothetical protein [Candidatus Woesearchaeota archaeon]